MSALAEFTLLPRTALPELARMAGEPGLQKLLETKGKSAAEFNWSGWILNPLLAYLSREIGMDRRAFEFAALSRDLSRSGEAIYEIFGLQEKDKFQAKLDPQLFAPEVLREFAYELSKASLTDAGEGMLAGIRALHKALTQIDESNVLLLSIG